MIGLKMKKIDISQKIDLMIPNPVCELNYNKDYELLIAIMLSAQTTDKRVNQVTSVLFDKYNSLEKLKNSNLSDIEEILRSLGSFRKKAEYVQKIATVILDEYNSVIPKEREKLEKLPGVGRKTVSVFLSELYDYPEFAVDTHVFRVSKRLNIANSKDDVKSTEMKLKKFFPKKEWAKKHKQLVLFGRYICKAVKPECDKCLLKEYCKEYKKRNK